MNNADIFFETLVNVRHEVLGLELKPFCILHLLWLQHIASPLFLTSKRIEIQDVEIAVIICSSSSSEEILAKLNPSSFWQRHLRKRWHRRNRREDLGRIVKQFLAYQDDYCSLPQLFTKDENRDEKLPWLLLYTTGLIKATGWNLEKVLALPLGQVIWLNIAFGYLASGETSVISDRERAAMDALRALTVGGTA